MRGIPTSRFRGPLFSRAALASALLAGAFLILYAAFAAAQGLACILLLYAALAVGAPGAYGVWRLAREESTSTLKLERSWKLRSAFLTVLAAGGLSVCVLALGRRVVHGLEDRQAQYDALSVAFEGQRLAPHYNGNMLSTDEVLPDGLHKSVDWDRTWIGRYVDGRESGEWKLSDSDGRPCGLVTMKGGEPCGPCEFWDASGKRRVSGAYKGWSKRVGLWTLDNVLGDGRTYVLYRPAWSVP